MASSKSMSRTKMVTLTSLAICSCNNGIETLIEGIKEKKEIWRGRKKSKLPWINRRNKYILPSLPPLLQTQGTLKIEEIFLVMRKSTFSYSLTFKFDIYVWLEVYDYYYGCPCLASKIHSATFCFCSPDRFQVIVQRLLFFFMAYYIFTCYIKISLFSLLC